MREQLHASERVRAPECQRITLTPGKTRQVALRGRQAEVTLDPEADGRGRRSVVIDWIEPATCPS
mgnify:CR=1 FL=1